MRRRNDRLGTPTTVRFSEDVAAWLQEQASSNRDGVAGVIRIAVEEHKRRVEQAAERARQAERERRQARSKVSETLLAALEED